MGAPVRPVKRLGQHFMTDPSIAQRIVDVLHLTADDEVLEIGPGAGALTAPLMESPAKRITAVEIDPRFAGLLEARFSGDDRFTLIQADFLKTDPTRFVHENLKVRVIGNLPYVVTSPILFRILNNHSLFRDATFTVQREVAERLVSLPGSKIYGVPSVLFQAFSHLRICFHISRHCFNPVPAVESAVVHITFHDAPLFPITDERFFIQLVKTAFGQRRKMLKNNLKSLISEGVSPESLPVDLTKRPESLTVDQFVQLSNVLAGQQHRRMLGRDDVF